MSLDTYLVSKVGHSLYEVKRYKVGALLESTTVDLMKTPRSDFETKRLVIAKKYASEGCPKGSAYWFSETGAISKTQLNESNNTEDEVLYERFTRQHFRGAADAIRTIEDPKKRQDVADHMAVVYAKSNPRFDHSKFHALAGTKYK